MIRKSLKELQERYEKLQLECKREILDQGLDLPLCSFVINSKARSRFGMCIIKEESEEVTIEISREVLEFCSDKNAKKCIIHELLHSIKGCYDHGNTWKYYASIMNSAYGYEISRTDSRDKLGLPFIDEEYKYIIQCNNCGRKTGFNRICNAVRHTEEYKCTLCKTQMVRIK